MDPSPRTSDPTPRTPAAGGDTSRRTIIWSAVLLAVVIIGGVAVVAATSDVGPRRDTQGQLPEEGGAKPHIIERPNSGRAPENPGERGGWEQLSLLGLIMVAVVVIVTVAVRGGGKKARAGRAAWKAAAATGRDGAAEEQAP